MKSLLSSKVLDGFDADSTQFMMIVDIWMSIPSHLPNPLALVVERLKSMNRENPI
jgi:hypothetical protein